MIVYNLRYRGPYEYDKMILNILQYHNTVHEIYKALHEDNNKNLVEAQNRLDDLNSKLNTLCEELMAYKEGNKEL